MLIFVGVSAFLPSPATVDLHVELCSDLAPGRAIGLRAYLYDDLLNPAGAEAIKAPVTVTLLREHDGGRRRLAQGQLEPSEVFGMEGSLVVPADLSGATNLVLEATVDRAEGPVTVRVPMRVDPDTACLSRRGRAAHPLQALSLGAASLSELGPGCADRAGLHVAVEGGACVPGHRCVVWLWADPVEAETTLKVSPVRGVSAAEVSARDATPRQGPVQGDAVSRGGSGRLFAVRVDTTAPEAALRISLERPCGAESRELQLPIALGAVPMFAEEGQLRVASGPAVALDLFAAMNGADVLVWSGSLPQSASDRLVPWPASTMPAGAVAQRLSIRPDVLGVETELALHRPVEPPVRVGSIPVWLKHLGVSPVLQDAPDTFLYAIADSDVIPRAGTYSSAQQGGTGHDERAKWATSIGQFLVFLLGLGTTLRVYRGGLCALEQVQALGRAMEDEVVNGESSDTPEAGQQPDTSENLEAVEAGFLRSRAQLLGLSLAVFLAFMAVAVILGVQMGRPG